MPKINARLRGVEPWSGVSGCKIPPFMASDFIANDLKHVLRIEHKNGEPVYKLPVPIWILWNHCEYVTTVAGDDDDALFGEDAMEVSEKRDMLAFAMIKWLLRYYTLAELDTTMRLSETPAAFAATMLELYRAENPG